MWHLLNMTEACVQWQPGGVHPCDAGLAPPFIIKPVAACGAAHAHDLTLVLHATGLAEADVAVPSIAQVFVDHGGLLYKAYVLGEQVFSASLQQQCDGRYCMQEGHLARASVLKV